MGRIVPMWPAIAAATEPTETTMNAPVMSQAELLAQIATLQASNKAMQDKLHAQANRKMSFKVSEKGAISIYGMGRFPVTLYFQQYEKLIAALPDLAEFVKANDKLLSRKV